MNLKCTLAWPITPNILPERAARLEEMMEERGIDLDHAALYRWIRSYAPEIEKCLCGAWCRATARFHVHEIYTKICGRWVYLYQAVAEQGQTIDFYLSQTRNRNAASRFLSQ